MTSSTAFVRPKFEKTNHHFIPQFWLRYFADSNGQLWKRQDGQVTRTSTSEIMAEDWLYTEFDRMWQPGDGVEDRLSRAESVGGQLFEALHASHATPSDADWARLCWWIGLTACRHPVAMRRGHERSKELGWSLADARAHPDEASFLADIRARFGVSLPEGLGAALARKGDEALLAEAEEVEDLSPQDPRLPMLLALGGAGEVAIKITPMDMILFDAPPEKTFVLGDTPVQVSGLAGGFAVPLSSRLALGVWPPDQSGTVIRDRRQADAETVALINQDQATRAMTVVVGPDRTALRALSRP